MEKVCEREIVCVWGREREKERHRDRDARGGRGGVPITQDTRQFSRPIILERKGGVLTHNDLTM